MTNATVNVTVTDANGLSAQMGTIIYVTTGGGGGGSLPAGVTLQQIDGGTTYYATQGLTHATASKTFTFQGTSVTYANGWDSSNFFPIGTWLNYIITGVSTDQTATWQDIGYNTAWSYAGAGNAGNLLAFRNAGISVVAPFQFLGQTIPIDGAPGTETVGMNFFDEPYVTLEAAQIQIQGASAASFQGTITGGTNLDIAPTLTGGPIVRNHGVFLNIPILSGVGVTNTPNVTDYNSSLGGTGSVFILPASANVGPEAMSFSAMPGMANSIQDGRFGWTNFQHGQIENGLMGSPQLQMRQVLSDLWQTPTGGMRHLDFATVDWYWFSAGAYCNNRSGNSDSGLNIYDKGGNSNTSGGTPGIAIQGIGPRYGDLIDLMRSTWFTSGSGFTPTPAPQYCFVETGNAFGEVSYDISPPEFNWAIWSTLIHGARGIMAFDNDDGNAWGGSSTPTNMFTSYFNTLQTATVTGSIAGSNPSVLTVTAVSSGHMETGMTLNTAGSPEIAAQLTCPVASFTGTVSGSTLTVASFSGNAIVPGTNCILNFAGSATLAKYFIAIITGFGTGSGGNGTYTLDRSPASVGPVSMSASMPYGGIGTYQLLTNVGAVGSSTIIGTEQIKRYNQWKKTYNLVHTLAPVLNADFAVGTIPGTNGLILSVSPSGGYLFPTPVVQSIAVGWNTITGIDCMAKWYTGSTYTTSGFGLNNTDSITTNTMYIFATPRQPMTNTNISATFTLCPGAGSSVTVINDAARGTIAINGSNQFTDTFVRACDVHIYKVNP